MNCVMHLDNGIPSVWTSKGNQQWYKNWVVQEIRDEVIVFDYSKNQGFEKSGFHCIFTKLCSPRKLPYLCPPSLWKCQLYWFFLVLQNPHSHRKYQSLVWGGLGERCVYFLEWCIVILRIEGLIVWRSYMGELKHYSCSDNNRFIQET